MTELVVRPLTAGEEPLFNSLADPALVGPAAFGARYADIAARGNYRPANTWVALRDGVVVARAAWWARPHDDEPASLDWFDFIDQDAAVELLRTAPGPAEYSLALPPDWRDRPAVAQAAQARITAAAHEADDLRAVIRHARIPRERAAEFWEGVVQLALEFMRLPRSGETVFGFVAGLYPTEFPTLPDPDHGPAGTADRPDPDR